MFPCGTCCSIKHNSLDPCCTHFLATLNPPHRFPWYSLTLTQFASISLMIPVRGPQAESFTAACARHNGCCRSTTFWKRGIESRGSSSPKDGDRVWTPILLSARGKKCLIREFRRLCLLCAKWYGWLKIDAWISNRMNWRFMNHEWNLLSNL